MKSRNHLLIPLLFFLISCDTRELNIDFPNDTSSDTSSDNYNTEQMPLDICPCGDNKNNLLLFPKPKFIFCTGEEIPAGRINFEVKSDEKVRNFFDEFIKFYEKNIITGNQVSNIRIYTYNGLSALSEKCNLNLNPEYGSYYLKVFSESNDIIVYIVADDSEGLYNGARSITHLIYKKSLREAAIYDYPDVRLRGVVEGFYGPPWKEDDRLDVISYLSLLKYNIFIYSPKSDAYAWAMWRTPFNEDEEERLIKLAIHSKRLGIIPCYGIGPGYDIRFSNARDYSLLLGKYKRLISYGFDSCLVLAFDDTQKTLSAEDSEKFTDMAEAQIYIAKRLYNDIIKIKPDIMLAFVPNDYTTEWAIKDIYLEKIGRELKDKYVIAWTGYYVVSPYITMNDVEEIEKIIGTTPALADNYPVSDLMFGGGAAFLGPITGRSPEIFSKIRIYVSNPMRYAISSLIPLGTIADMLWSSQNYESERSFKESIRFFSNKDRDNDIYEFVTNLRSSLLTDEESPELRSAVNVFLADINNCDSIYYSLLKDKFFDRFTIIDKILEGAADDRFIYELKPFKEKLRYYGEAGNLAIDLMKRRCKGEVIADSEINKLSQMITFLKGEKYRICADVMNNFLDEVYKRIIGKD